MLGDVDINAFLWQQLPPHHRTAAKSAIEITMATQFLPEQGCGDAEGTEMEGNQRGRSKREEERGRGAELRRTQSDFCITAKRHLQDLYFKLWKKNTWEPMGSFGKSMLRPGLCRSHSIILSFKLFI